MVTRFLMITFALTQLAMSKRRQMNGIRQRVIAGRDDTDHPFVVLLAKSMKLENIQMVARACTGSLLAENWVLIAAHCVEKEPKEDLRIIYDNFTIPSIENNRFMKVSQYFTHPGHRISILNDIALILINGWIKISHYGKLSAVDFRSLIGRPVNYYGFGYTRSDYIYTKYPLEAAFSQIADDVRPLQRGEAVVAKCDKSEQVESIPTAFICLRPKCSNYRQRLQNGDSGGPVIYRGKIVGVATGKKPDSNYYMMYTAVSPYISWLTKIMSSNGKT